MVPSTKQNEVTFARLMGYEPSLFEASDEVHEALFTDPLDDVSIPKLHKKTRFPSLASLRAQRAAVTSDTAARTVREEDGCLCKTFLGPVGQKDEVERADNTPTLEERYRLYQLKVFIWLVLPYLVFGNLQNTSKKHLPFLTRCCKQRSLMVHLQPRSRKQLMPQ